MSENIQSFLDQVKDVATVLEESEIIDLITVVENQISVSKLQLLVLGTIGSGRFSTTNVLLGQSKLLPISPIPKAPIPVNINYGETVTAEVAEKNGLKTVVPIEKLQTFLTNPHTNAATYQSVEIQTSCDFVKTSSLRIEAINNKRESKEWKEILAGTDYIILVLNAVALLSEPERKFIKDIIIPYFGLERVVILLNKIDLIPEDEKSSISELVKKFLGSFESQPILIDFSADKINQSDNKLIETGYEALINLLKSDLFKNFSHLKLAAIRQTLEICLTELEQAAALQNSLITTNEADIEDLLNKIKSKNQWLERRIEKAHNKVEAFINTIIKEQLLREIENFSLILKEQLDDEIMPIEDITTIKKYLPGYLEALWVEFFNAQQINLRNQIMEEVKRIHETVKEDLKEFIGDTGNNFPNILNEFDPSPTNMVNFLMPQRATNNISNVATTLQLGGFLLLAINFPVGLTSIGAGTITRIISKKSIQNSEKEAIVKSAVNTIKELEAQIKKQVNNNFSELTNQLKSAITDLYNQQIDHIRNELENSLKSQQKIITKKEDIARLTNVTIPQLRQLFNQIAIANN